MRSSSTYVASTTTSFSDLGREMWSYLTGQGATIDYTFVDMKIAAGDNTAATWKVNGTLRLTTSDKDHCGAVNTAGPDIDRRLQIGCRPRDRGRQQPWQHHSAAKDARQNKLGFRC